MTPATASCGSFGFASLDDYETAIRQVEFSSTSADAGDEKRIAVTIFDGFKISPEVFAFIDVVADTRPSLDLDDNDSSGAGGPDYTATFRQGGLATPIADVDVAITDRTARPSRVGDDHAGDQPASRRPAGHQRITARSIEASDYDPNTGVLRLEGPATRNFYEAALRQVVFSTSGVDDHFTGDRVIEVTVNDGNSTDSEIARTYMHVERGRPTAARSR